MKNLDNYHKGIISVCIGGIILLLVYANFNWPTQGKYLFDESIVSFLAFTMLIITALMQNRDLRLQREEMKMTRAELEGSKQAQEQQKEEMIKSNELVIQNIKQTQFFELLRMKEEIIMSKDINFLQKSNELKNEILKIIITDQSYEQIMYLSDELTTMIGEEKMDTYLIKGRNNHKNITQIIITIFITENLSLILSNQNIRRIFEQRYEEVYKNILSNQPSTYFKLYNINQTIIELISDKKVKGSIERMLERITAPGEALINHTNQLLGLGYTKKDLTVKDIHNKLLVRGEREFYELLSTNYQLDDLINKVDK